LRLHGRRRVIVTVLDESVRDEPGKWGELDKLVSEMEVKPRLEDFPKSNIGRAPVSF